MQASSNSSQEQQEEEVDPLHQSEASTDSWLDASVPAASGAAMAEGGGGGGGGRAQGQPQTAPPPPVLCGAAAFMLCVECEDQSAEVTCMDCQEDFCRPCFASQHRRGKRSEHRVQALLGEMMAAPEVPESTADVKGLVIVQQAEGPGAGAAASAGGGGGGGGGDEAAMAIDDAFGGGGDEEDEEDEGMLEEAGSGADQGLPAVVGEVDEKEFAKLVAKAEAAYDAKQQKLYLDKCRTVPLRLTPYERKLLAVLESALNVSEYTDKVDTMSRRPKQDRIISELEHVFATILGLMICCEPAKGVELVRRDVRENEHFFRGIFEVGRRYKIMNPDRMRGTYGKLMYMLQDTQNRYIQPKIGFNCVKPVLTVVSFLEERGALSLLQDARVMIATRDITDRGGRRSREEVAADVVHKQRAARELKATFAGPGAGFGLTPDDVQRVLDSVADANNYLNFNAGPVRRMVLLLKEYFDAQEIEAGFSLAIGGGGGGRSYGYKSRSSSSYSYGGGYGSSYFRASDSGAKLSHSHATQFQYVHQSLRLWREIMRRMFCLWYEADADLLSPHCSYQLLNTGQGLNRVQSCPNVGSEMRTILGTVQRECGAWVGLSVVHLGDRDVPNALMFIDKYTQVPRILAPIARVVEQLRTLFENPALKSYAEEVWDSPDNLRMHVLVDFFKHAFDGDGDDGGSCIDGRLTSAWNWCSKLGKKPYYYAFMLSGFQGFDGDFKN